MHENFLFINDDITGHVQKCKHSTCIQLCSVEDLIETEKKNGGDEANDTSPKLPAWEG